MSESKSESKTRNDDELAYDELAEELPGCSVRDPILIRAANWFTKPNKRGDQNRKFEIFEKFAKENCSIFENELDLDEVNEDDGTGLSLECYDCHKKYLKLFEREVEAFIEEEGDDIKEFYSECEQTIQGKSLTIFENESYQWFVDVLFRALDYTSFHKDMRKMAMKQGRRTGK